MLWINAKVLQKEVNIMNELKFDFRSSAEVLEQNNLNIEVQFSLFGSV